MRRHGGRRHLEESRVYPSECRCAAVGLGTPLIVRLSDELGDAGSIQSWFIGESESRIFCYGPSGDHLRERIMIAVADDELAGAAGCAT